MRCDLAVDDYSHCGDRVVEVFHRTGTNIIALLRKRYLEVAPSRYANSTCRRDRETVNDVTSSDYSGPILGVSCLLLLMLTRE